MGPHCLRHHNNTFSDSSVTTTAKLVVRICLTLVVSLRESRYLEIPSTAKPFVSLLLLTTLVLTPLSISYVSTRDRVVKYSLFSIGSCISCFICASVEKTIGNYVCFIQLLLFVVGESIIPVVRLFEFCITRLYNGCCIRIIQWMLCYKLIQWTMYYDML